jgi:hypothetical protein
MAVNLMGSQARKFISREVLGRGKTACDIYMYRILKVFAAVCSTEEVWPTSTVDAISQVAIKCVSCFLHCKYCVLFYAHVRFLIGLVGYNPVLYNSIKRFQFILSLTS